MSDMGTRYRELRADGMEHGEALRKLADERDEREAGTPVPLLRDVYRDALERIAAGTDKPRDVARRALAGISDGAVTTR